MITEKTLKEESTNKNYYDDNYSASIYAMHALFAFDLLTVYPFIFSFIQTLGIDLNVHIFFFVRYVPWRIL